MNSVGQSERTTQNRVVALLRDELHYRHLGDRLPVRHEDWDY